MRSSRLGREDLARVLRILGALDEQAIDGRVNAVVVGEIGEMKSRAAAHWTALPIFTSMAMRYSARSSAA